MQTCFAVPVAYYPSVQQFNSFEVTVLHTDNIPPLTAKPLFLLHEEHRGKATLTEITKYAKHIKAIGLILESSMVPKFLDRKDAGDFKLVVAPSGKTYDELWADISNLAKLKVNQHPSFLAWGLDSKATSFMLYDKHLPVPDAYGSRPSVVQRLTRQSFTKDDRIMLLGGGLRGGRELAEYKFIRNVQWVYTADAWDMAKAGCQLGLPTKGRQALSSLDYELKTWYQLTDTSVDNDVLDVLIPNILTLKGLC